MSPHISRRNDTAWLGLLETGQVRSVVVHIYLSRLPMKASAAAYRELWRKRWAYLRLQLEAREVNYSSTSKTFNGSAVTWATRPSIRVGPNLQVTSCE